MTSCIQVCFRLLFRMECGGKIYFGNNNSNEEEVEYEEQEKERVPSRTYGLNDDCKLVKWNESQCGEGS